MKTVEFTAKFPNGNNIDFTIEDLVMELGSIVAGDCLLEEQIGEDLAYLKENFDKAKITLKKGTSIVTCELCDMNLLFKGVICENCKE